MSEMIYTRKGPVRPSEDRRPIKTYRVPTATDDEIRINIPISATKEELSQAAEILQVALRYWEGENEKYTDRS